MPITDLHFEQYLTVEPGDMITVWRGNWCVGHIRAESNGNFEWTFSAAQASEFGTTSTYPMAQEEMVERFLAFCGEVGVVVEGESPRPDNLIDWSTYILRHVSLCERASEAKDYMNDRVTQRRLRELNPEVRGILSRKIRALIARLTEQEAHADEEEFADAPGRPAFGSGRAAPGSFG